jgi:hypothetical protein
MDGDGPVWDQAAPAAIVRASSAMVADVTRILASAERLPDRSNMNQTVTPSCPPAKRFALDQSICDIKSKHQNGGANCNPQAQPFFQLGANGIAIPVEQDGNDEEPAAAGDNRAQDE